MVNALNWIMHIDDSHRRNIGYDCARCSRIPGVLLRQYCITHTPYRRSDRPIKLCLSASLVDSTSYRYNILWINRHGRILKVTHSNIFRFLKISLEVWSLWICSVSLICILYASYISHLLCFGWANTMSAQVVWHKVCV